MVYIQLKRRALLALYYRSAGMDLVVLTFQLLLDCETVIFFLFCFLSFMFPLSVSIVFLDVFLVSLPSLTHSPPSPCSRQEGTTICFAPIQTIRSTIRDAFLINLRKKYGLFCGLKDFALIDVLVSPAWQL